MAEPNRSFQKLGLGFVLVALILIALLLVLTKNRPSKEHVKRMTGMTTSDAG